MDVKFLDLKKINVRFQDSFRAQLDLLMDRAHYILGPEVKAFEDEFARYCGSGRCLGVANGLDALILILKGLISLKKLKEGDEVAIQGNTFVATALAAVHSGLKIRVIAPKKGFNLTLSDIETQISHKTKALLLVHLYGEMRDTAAIAEFCSDREIILVEDAAQAHGASWDGIRAGGYGIAAGFSFYPGKNLGALGDGGAVLVNDDELYEEISYLRNYGSKIKYQHDRTGFNSRLDEIQAGFLRAKLPFLDQDNTHRMKIAERYSSEIKNSKIILPEVGPNGSQIWHLFVIRASKRDELAAHLKFRGIETLIHYPKPIHAYSTIEDNIVAINPYDVDSLNNSIISIPISPVMSDTEVDYVIKALNDF